MANPLKKAKKKLSKAKKKSGLDKMTKGLEKGAREVGRGVETAAVKPHVKAGQVARDLHKDARDVAQGAAEAVTGKPQRDLMEAQAKYNKSQKQAIEKQKKMEQVEIAKADALKEKKMKTARYGRRSLLGG